MKMSINIIAPRSGYYTTDDNTLSLSKSTMSFGAGILERMKLESNKDFVLVGNVGQTIFIAKKPLGAFGWKLSKQATSKRSYIASKPFQDLKLGNGEFILKEAIEDELETEMNGIQKVIWYKVERVS